MTFDIQYPEAARLIETLWEYVPVEEKQKYSQSFKEVIFNLYHPTLPGTDISVEFSSNRASQSTV